MSNITAIIPAGGSGSRMGLPIPKQFWELAGCPVLIHTLRAFQASPAGLIIVVVPAGHEEATRALVRRFGLSKATLVVTGGTLRQDSVRAGLAAAPSDTELVVVHDAARPLISPALIRSCIEAADRSGAAMAAIPVADTLKEVADGLVVRTVDRQSIWQAQTPQAARAHLLRRAFAAADEDGFTGTDEASILERIGIRTSIVEGAETNLKITRPDDLAVAEALLQVSARTGPPQKRRLPAGGSSMRIGHGYDAHRLVTGRPLVLGGVVIPHAKGLMGHSDADVLTHALCDAVLGAVGQGDIGRHFPDTEERYRGVDSLKLLAEVMRLAARHGFALANADVTVIAQQPKLVPHFHAMKENLAAVCRVSPEKINLKATTTEKMGFAGREEGIAAHAVALLVREAPDSQPSGGDSASASR